MSANEMFNEDILQNLKQRVAGGDERAFRQLFDIFSHKLTSFAWSMLKVKHGATEVVDQVFVKILATTATHLFYRKSESLFIRGHQKHSTELSL